MSPQQQSLISRLRSFSKELYSLDQKPLVDPSFTFPWGDYAKALASIFGCPIDLTRGELGWKSKANLFEGIPSPHVPISLELPGINGSLQLVISTADIEILMGRALKVTPLTLRQQDPQFLDQFVLFTTAELFASAQTLAPLQALSPKLSTPKELDDPGCLALDIHITIDGSKGLARFLISPEFLESWRTARAFEAKTTSAADSLTTTLALEAGRTFLTPQELASLQLGDFLLIDHPFFVPNSPKSRMYLTLQGKPLFRAKLKDDTVQVLEMPLENEAFTPIGGLTMPAIPEDPSSTDEEPFETEEASTKEEPTEEDTALPPLTEQEVRSTLSISPRLIKEPLHIENIPLSVVVQLAELTMTVSQLSALQPGNLLDLQVRPENGVSLVVNGRVFATGDLVVIGDNVGVQIKEIGLEPPRAT